MRVARPIAEKKPERTSFGPFPRQETVLITVTLGLAGALGVGSLIADRISDPEPWLYLAAYSGPIAVVSAACWLIGRWL